MSASRDIRDRLRKDAAVRRIVAAWRRLTGGSRVRDEDRRTLVACSGGADSSALALAVWAGHGGSVMLGHVIHDLRSAELAEADRETTRRLAAMLGVPILERRIAVADLSGNAEANARRFRYEALAAIAAHAECVAVATAHHAGDQAETVLMRLKRGVGLSGLGGIAPRRRLTDEIPLIRPMLGVSREDCERICALAGWDWATDHTNADTRRERSHIRHEVIPALDAADPALVRGLVRAAELGSEAGRIVRRRAAEWLESGRVPGGSGGGFSWEREILREEPGVVLGAIARAASAEITGGGLDKLSKPIATAIARAIRDSSEHPRNFTAADARWTITAHLVECRHKNEEETDMAKKVKAGAAAKAGKKQAKAGATGPKTGKRTAVAAADGGISVHEYRERRERILEELGDAVGLVFAGDGAAPLVGQWRADTNFRYLTGIGDEGGAAVLFDPLGEDERRRCILFLRPLNPEMEAWDGYRDPISDELKARYGFETVMRTNALPRMLTNAARLRKRLAVLHPPSVYDAPVTQDLAAFRKVSERVLGCAMLDKTQVLPTLRGVKSEAELDLMRKAAAATARAYDAAVGAIRADVREIDVQRAMERAWQEAGAEAWAYNPIIGAGLNSTVLHYGANRETMRDGEVLLIDAGASYRGYACDVTRTYPVNGSFTKRQREVYEAVLEAQAAAIEATRPGARFHQIDEAARKVLRKAGLENRYIHGIGHHLGLEVHDSTPDGELKPGMVITIEPGAYLPEEKIGVRIEDDILVTKSGNENLTRAIPKSVKEIESLLRG